MAHLARRKNWNIGDQSPRAHLVTLN